MTTMDIPVVDEAHAMARLDALTCEHMLPEPERRQWTPDLWAGDEVMQRICGSKAVVSVMAAVRTDVARWAAVLGVQEEARHMIHEYDDGKWCAVWTQQVWIPDWLPGVTLAVRHNEQRWIDPPQPVVAVRRG